MLSSFTPLESPINHGGNVKRGPSFNNKARIKTPSFLTGFTTRFRNFIWFLIFTFTLYCMPNFELLIPYKVRFYVPEAEAAETQVPETQTPAQEEVSGTPSSKEAPPTEETSTLSSTSVAALATGDGGSGTSSALGIQISIPENSVFTGAATQKIPIKVPPGRGGMAPQISLTYNSYKGSGWVGVGWNLDIGAIQRSTKRGVNYSANDYVAVMNGSYSELLPTKD